nr:Ldh family oxidoreductase [Acidisphaera sp. L21]
MLSSILVAHGCSPHVATILAANCATAERDGSTSHGLFRMRHYVSTLRSGWVDGRAEPVIADAAPGFVRADAKNGFAQIALAEAAPLLVQKARTNGIAVLAIRQSHHLGALYLDVEPFALQGLVALTVVNSIAVVAPHAGSRAVYGTNPIAFAAPTADGAPLVFDQATSTAALGDVRVAQQAGHDLPYGAGLDRAGQPTNDPAAILDGGALLPFGGYKGAAISLMVEILCAALVGANFSFEVDSSAYPGAKTGCTGQTIIVIDPAAGSDGLAPLPARVSTLVAALQDAGQTYIPGGRRLIARSQPSAPIDPAVWTELRSLLPA